MEFLEWMGLWGVLIVGIVTSIFGMIASMPRKEQRAILRKVEKIIRIFNPKYALVFDVLNNKFDGENIDQRIAKIDLAHDNLRDAIVAIDELREQAADNKIELQRTLELISEASEEKLQKGKELELVQSLAEADIDAFRTVAGIPTRKEIRKGKWFAFFSGILASLLASILFLQLDETWNWILSIWVTFQNGPT